MAGFPVRLSEEAYWLLHDKVSKESLEKKERLTMKNVASKIIKERLGNQNNDK